MAANRFLHQSSLILYPLVVLLIIISSIPQSLCQSKNPQNIQVFYPFLVTPPPSNSTPTSPAQPPPPPPPATSSSSSSSSSNKKVGAAVGITAATTLVLSGLLFFLIQRCSNRRKKETIQANPYAGTGPVLPPQNDFMRFKGNLKGVIVDEDGLDVIYWKKLEGADGNNRRFEKQAVRNLRNNIEEQEQEEEEKKIISKNDHRKYAPPSPEFPLLRGKSSTSQSAIWNDVEDRYQKNASGSRASYSVGKQEPSIEIPTRSPPPPPPPPPPQVAAGAVASKDKGIVQPPSTPPPPPPPPPTLPTAAVVAPIVSVAAGAAASKDKGIVQQPPPPPPIPLKKAPPPPPVLLPKAKTVAVGSVSKPPPIPKGSPNDGSKKIGSTEEGEGQVKLKPLHWDKVNRNVDHSMVWDKLDGGSFKVDDDLMEALFGYVATNRKSPRTNSSESTPKGKRDNQSGSSSQIFILDTRKSQNIAIVLKSLGVSRNEIIDALVLGEDLNIDTLEKLTRIAPTKEEESEILAFNGDPARLADAESFLCHLLKSVPSAFTRFNAMLFRSNFNLETPHLRESFQTLELGCKELRARGLLLKLLEAILKAGNRMNAGTSRGNAQAFNLTALRKLSDVKSTDGKTTLLHFVVEEVVRAEGKRCVINRKGNLSRSNSQSSNAASPGTENAQSREDREKEYIRLGLPIVGGLSVELCNVKKAASIDYDSLLKAIAGLGAQVGEIRKLVQQCGNDRGGFVEDMKSFVNAAEEEMRIIGEEHIRVTELVKRTTEYFQSGASKDKSWQPLQIFAIVKDFLDMVDKACVDIARNLQKRKPATANTSSGSSPPGSPESRPSVKFPKLPANFMSS